MAGMEAESPISRYPAGSSSGRSKRVLPNGVTGTVMPGCARWAHADAGPAGSCSTKSIAKRPVAASASVRV